MPLTLAEKARLARKYEPHLVLPRHHFGFPPEDILNAPIDPDVYIRASALWSDLLPDRPQQGAWGIVAGPGQRVPNFAPGSIEADPQTAAVAGTTRLAHALAQNPSAFLDFGGWLEKSPFEDSSTPLPPPAGAVTFDTRNMMGHLHYGRTQWTPWASDAGDPFVTAPPWYTAEVFDLTDLMGTLLQLGPNPAVDMLHRVYSQLGGDAWFIWYHYFFPSYESLLARCEMVALMNAIGAKLPDEPTAWQTFWSDWPLTFDSTGRVAALVKDLEEAGSHFSLPYASYLGDFVSVAVIVRAPTEGTVTGPVRSPLDIGDEEFQAPLFVGYGSKTSSLEQVDTQAGSVYLPRQEPLMRVVAGDEFKREGLHPLVFVAQGTNNTHFTPGRQPRPRAPVHPSVCDVLDVSDDAPVPNTGKRKRRHAVSVSLGKIAAGFAAGGLFGALAGAIAAALEATQRDFGPNVDALPAVDDQSDEAPSGLEAGFVIRSEELRHVFGDSDESFTYWPDDTATMIVDFAEPPDWLNQPSLRFGVPCVEDPFGHRSGKTQPDFHPVVILALAEKLGKG